MKSKILILLLIITYSCKNEPANNNIDEGEIEKTIDSIDIKPLEFHEKLIKNKTNLKFKDFTVKVFEGILAEPNFEFNPFANDKEYVDFIKNGCKKNKVNFAGHYTIIEKNCGAQCLHIFIINRITGEIHTDFKPKDGRFGYEYRKNSSLLIANSSLFIDDKFEEYYEYFCKPEYYKWSGINSEIIENKINNKTENTYTKKDSIQIKIIKKETEKLVQLIINNKRKEIAKMIDFPLTHRGSNAFGYNQGGPEDDIEINKKQMLKKYDYFFRKPFIDSLKVKLHSFKINKYNEEIGFNILINTWDPKNKNRDWGLECTHQVGGYLKNDKLRINWFNLLCGGVM